MKNHEDENISMTIESGIPKKNINVAHLSFSTKSKIITKKIKSFFQTHLKNTINRKKTV